MKNTESKTDKIYRAVAYYKNGTTDIHLLAAKMKVHWKTIYNWSNTELWQSLLPGVDFQIPTKRKNLHLFEFLKRQYFAMTKVPEHNRISILLRHPECTVKRATLFIWRRLWLRAAFQEV